MNLSEADDAERERVRLAMGETYRTLLGDLRHEAGHYFWDRLVRGSGQLERFREFFGDERQDYQGALQAHYANGPVQNWQQSYISGYASAASVGRFLPKLGRTICTSWTHSKCRSRSVSAFGQGLTRGSARVSLWTSIHMSPAALIT